MTAKLRSLTLLAILSIVGVASIGTADEPPASQPPVASDEWRDADLQAMVAPGESFRSTTMVAIAYTFIWLMVLGFVASVWLRLRQVDRELADLRRRIEGTAPSVPKR